MKRICIATTIALLAGEFASATYNYSGELDVVTGRNSCSSTEDAFFSKPILDGRIQVAINAGAVTSGWFSDDVISTCQAEGREEFRKKYLSAFQHVFFDIIPDQKIDRPVLQVGDIPPRETVDQLAKTLVIALEKRNIITSGQPITLYIKAAFDGKYSKPVQSRMFILAGDKIVDDSLYTEDDIRDKDSILTSFMIASVLGKLCPDLEKEPESSYERHEHERRMKELGPCFDKKE